MSSFAVYIHMCAHACTHRHTHTHTYSFTHSLTHSLNSLTIDKKLNDHKYFKVLKMKCIIY